MDWETVAGLTVADADVQETIAASTSQTVQGVFAGMDWLDHAAITVAATSAGAVVRAAAQQAASMTAAYLTRVLREMVSADAAAVGTLRITDPLRMGVASWATAYGRVADTVRYQISQGKSPQDAVRIAMDRADAMARTDLALARRLQSREAFEDSKRVIGYRRVVHPELSKGGSCGLCISAANRTYHKADLMRIHQRCKCTVLPITAAHDPGGAFDLDPAFAKAYDLSLSTSAADLKDVRVRFEEHGELGPILVNAEHRSRNPGVRREARREAARQARPGDPPRAPRRPAGSSGGFNAMTREQLENQLRITIGLKDSEWRTEYLARLRARLAELG